MTKKSNKYTAKNIKIVTPGEHVRRRPELYIGGVDKVALHNLLSIAIDTSIESAFEHKCSSICISLLPDNWISIKDNDEILPELIASGKIQARFPDRKAIDAVMLETHILQHFKNSKYMLNGGYGHGVSLDTVNPLCEKFNLTIRHKGEVWKRGYRKGIGHTALQHYATHQNDTTGVEITFQPDFTIFDANNFDYDLIAQRCRDIAYTVPHLTIELEDQRENPVKRETFHYPDGLKALIAEHNHGKNTLTDIMYHRETFQATNYRDEPSEIVVEFAYQLTDSAETRGFSFANTVPTPDGGTHIEGFKAGMVSFVNSFTSFREEYQDWEQISLGLTYAISVFHHDSQFESISKVRLINREFYALVPLAILHQALPSTTVQRSWFDR